MSEKQFNIRVYGLLINENHEVLLSDENRFGRQFTKFPGGGLEWGEGTRDCLAREFKEELGIEVAVKDVFYLTDFFQASAFNSNDQLISIYYLVEYPEWKSIKVATNKFDFTDKEEVHRWAKIADLSSEDVTFPIDKIVVQQLIQNN